MAQEKDRILKAGNIDAIVRPLTEAREDLILPREAFEALLKAETILEAARQDAEQVREEARQEGLAQGLRQALAIIEQARAHQDEMIERAEADVVALAMATAEKLIGRSLERQPELMVDLVERAFAEIASAREVVIRVAPQTGPLLESARQRLAERTGATRVTIETDPALTHGDCVIETEIGRIDARLAVQLETIMTSLTSEETE